MHHDFLGSEGLQGTHIGDSKGPILMHQAHLGQNNDIVQERMFVNLFGKFSPLCCVHTKNHHLNLNSTYCARPRYLPSSSRWLESRSRVPWTLEAELSEAALFADLSSSRSVLPSAMVEAQASKNRIFLWNWLDSLCFESSWDNNHCFLTFWQNWAISQGDKTRKLNFFHKRVLRVNTYSEDA